MYSKLRTTHHAFPSTVSSVAAMFDPLEGRDCPVRNTLRALCLAHLPQRPESFLVQVLGYFSWPVSGWACTEWIQAGGRLQSLWTLIYKSDDELKGHYNKAAILIPTWECKKIPPKTTLLAGAAAQTVEYLSSIYKALVLIPSTV